MNRVLLVLALAGCPGPGQTSTRHEGEVAGSPPRMVVLVVIEDFPEWSFEAKRAAFTNGFARLLGEGEWRVGRTASVIPGRLAAPTFTLTDAEVAPMPWTPSDAQQLATLSGTTDAQRGEVGIFGLGPTFPHDPASTPAPALAARATPLANQSTLDHALRLIEHERPARLVITFPAHAAVARGWGHESWEAWDMELGLDRGLAALLDALDANVGRDRWAMIVTSDHGSSRLPERSGGGGRISVEQLQRAANAAASLNLGTGDWIAPITPPYVAFTPAALAQNKKELANAYRKVIFALRAFPGLEIADRTDAYTGHCDQRSGDSREICESISPAHGQFLFFPAQGWIIDSEAEPRATSFGSLHDDDRTVPVILLPFGRTLHDMEQRPRAEMSLAEIEPLLSAWRP